MADRFNVTRIPNILASFDEVRKYLSVLVRDLEIKDFTKQFMGFYDYNDTATTSTPISLSAGTWTKLTNDGLGTYSNDDYGFKGKDPLWVAGSTNQFDWSQLSLGDTVDIRVDIDITTTTPNTEVKLALFMGVGSGAEFPIYFGSSKVFKAASTYKDMSFTSVYFGTTTALNYPAELRMLADHNASVVVNGWYVRVIKRQM